MHGYFNLNSLPLAGPVVGDGADVLVHGRGGGHPVELLEALPVRTFNRPIPSLFPDGPSLTHDEVPVRLVVAGKEPAHHHKVRTRPERLRHVPRARAAPVRDDVPWNEERG